MESIYVIVAIGIALLLVVAVRSRIAKQSPRPESPAPWHAAAAVATAGSVAPASLAGPASSIMTASLMKPLSALAAGECPIVGVNIFPPASAGTRRNFHLAMLLDVSGSMSGRKLDSVRTTLLLLLDAVQAGDCLTLIAFEGSARMVANAVVISDATKPTLRTAIQGLVTGGSTNLLAGIDMLRSVVHPTEASKAASVPHARPVDALVILTDGQIDGNPTTRRLMDALSTALPPRCPISTIGYGADCNSGLLRDLASRSRGTYTFVASDEQVAAVVGDLIGGLAMEVGRNATLMIPPGWRCMEFGASATDATYFIGTLISAKRQWVVLQGPTPCTTLPQITLSWVSNGQQRTASCAIDSTTNTPVEIAEQRDRAHVAVVLNTVHEHLEARRSEEARAVLTTLRDFLAASLAKDTGLTAQLRSQADELLGDLRSGFDGATLASAVAACTNTLSSQRGMFYGMSAASATAAGAVGRGTFCSPSQQIISDTMSAAFLSSQPPAGPTPAPNAHMPHPWGPARPQRGGRVGRRSQSPVAAVRPMFRAQFPGPCTAAFSVGQDPTSLSSAALDPAATLPATLPATLRTARSRTASPASADDLPTNPTASVAATGGTGGARQRRQRRNADDAN